MANEICILYILLVQPSLARERFKTTALEVSWSISISRQQMMNAQRCVATPLNSFLKMAAFNFTKSGSVLRLTGLPARADDQQLLPAGCTSHMLIR